MNRLIDRIIVRWLISLSGSRWDGLSAVLFHLAVRRIAAAPTAQGIKPFNLLILTKPMFNEDVLTTFGNDPRFRLYGVHRQVFKALARSFLSIHVDDNNYVNLEAVDEAGKHAYRAYCVRVLRWLLKFRRYHAVLTANYAYHAEREWAAACETVGVPFIALHKENIRSPGFASFMEKIYRERRGPFTGRRILVYNQLEKDIECRAGVAPADCITVTGMPRMDRCHAIRRDREPSRQQEARVLFFSFGPKTLLPGIVRKLSGPPHTRYWEKMDADTERLGWRQLFDDMHQAMLKLAVENPDITVLIKSKGVSGDKETAQIMSALKVDRLPANLKVLFGGDPLECIVRSDVVCGFNTTALLESVAVGIPVVVPRWGEYVDPIMSHYIVDFEDAVEYVNSVDEMVKRLCEHARARRPRSVELSASAVRMLDYWLGNADGRAGERVREAVLAEIEGRPHHVPIAP